MQWVLQPLEDTQKLAAALTALGLPFTWHKVIPFVGDLVPEPTIRDPHAVVLFGAYALWRYAERRRLRPGVFKIRPFVHEPAWQASLLNGPGARFMRLDEVPGRLTGGDGEGDGDDGPDDAWFVRPVDDSKALPGGVRTVAEIRAMAVRVLALDPGEIPDGTLRPDTALMLTPPARIAQEWRVWVVEDRIVTASLYRQGRRVVYRPGIDADARAFAETLVAANPGYAPAYVMDVCRTAAGLRLVETNCVNAAGFYAADLVPLAAAIDALGLAAA